MHEHKFDKVKDNNYKCSCGKKADVIQLRRMGISEEDTNFSAIYIYRGGKKNG